MTFSVPSSLQQQRRLSQCLLAIAALLLPLALLVALTIGRYPVSLAEVMAFVRTWLGWGAMPAELYDTLYNVLVDIRLPRLLAAVLIGAALASAGAAFQAVFRNPLVSPGLLGVLSGAAFGAALGMLMQASWWGVQVLAFACGLLAVGVGVLIALLFGRASVIMLVLGGVISSGLFGALLAIVKYLADPQEQLPSIVYWQMGSLAKVQLSQVLWLAGPIVLGVILLCILGQALDALTMGDDEARALGVPVHWVRAAVIAVATLVSALTVSMAGTIGWVGLIVPHIARMLVGPGNRVLLPLSALLGALFLLLCDAASRAATGAEIPIGIVTELVGIPVFLLVLHRVRKGWA